MGKHKPGRTKVSDICRAVSSSEQNIDKGLRRQKRRHAAREARRQAAKDARAKRERSAVMADADTLPAAELAADVACIERAAGK